MAKNAAGHSVLQGTWSKNRQKRCRSWCFTGDLEQKTAKTLQVVAGNGVRLVGNAARRMARRAAKWLCIRGMLKTNRPILPIYFQEVAEYQQDRCPANAAACGGLADGECRYRDAVFSGGTDLPFPRRGGKWPRQGNGRSERGETAGRSGAGKERHSDGKRGSGETGKRRKRTAKRRAAERGREGV